MRLEEKMERANRREKNIGTGDKKALRKLLLMTGSCAVIGFLGGLAGAGMAEQLGDFGAKIVGALAVAAPYSNLALTTAVWGICACLVRKGRSVYRNWNGEDEDVIEAVEKMLSRAFGITNVNQILGMFFFGTGICGLDFGSSFGSSGMISGAAVFLGFLYMLVVNAVLQGKIVNFTKEINPEKRGSVYDIKFQKIWMDSCDEMEKSQIYQAGFAAMQTTIYTCMGLWIFCMFGMMLWDFGILPMTMVIFIWVVLTIKYQIVCQKNSESQKK